MMTSSLLDRPCHWCIVENTLKGRVKFPEIGINMTVPKYGVFPAPCCDRHLPVARKEND